MVSGLVLARNAPHVDAAYDLIDGMLAPDIGAYCIRTFGYGHSNVTSFALVRKPRPRSARPGRRSDADPRPWPDPAARQPGPAGPDQPGLGPDAGQSLTDRR